MTTGYQNWILRIISKIKGIFAISTFKANHIQKCPLAVNKDMEKEGRGSNDHRFDFDSRIVIIKWVYNSTETLVSNYVGIQPEGAIERWFSKKKEKVEVPCPRMVYIYNEKMRGVDLADMLYCIKVKTKRWYIKIFWYLVDICKVNAWLLYRRHCKQMGLPTRKVKSLMKFSCEVAEALIHASKTLEKPQRGRPSKRASVEFTPSVIKRRSNPLPVADVRYHLS